MPPRYGYHAPLHQDTNDSSYDAGRAVVQVNDSRSQLGSSSGLGSRGGIGRNTSLRSVLTLPPYNPEARETERVLGREGERDGIDVVLELRTAEEEESLRNAEMEQLYQIRQLRRTWNAQREERREARREARARGDVATLERLRDEAQAARDNTELDALRRELEDIKAERDGRASVVSYADVGVARHDGTRLRAGSVSSVEQVGLLSDAESMAQGGGGPSPHLEPGSAAGGGRNRSSSAASVVSAWQHRRVTSNSSVLGIDTEVARASSPPGVVRSREGSPPALLGGRQSRRQSEQRADAIDEVDLGDEMMPPRYDDVERISIRSATATPTPAPSQVPDEPPPGYSSSGGQRVQAREGQQVGLAILMADGDEGEQERNQNRRRRSDRVVIEEEEEGGRGGGGPRLPLADVPQIVVEPSRPVS